MKILRSYVLFEHLPPFLMSLAVFTFVLMMGNLVKLADLVINKGVAVGYVARFFVLLLPFLLSYTIPMALLTALLLALGRLGQDNELTAMRASGISLWRLAWPLAMLALVASIGMTLLNDRVVPWAHFESRKLLKEIGIRRPAAYLEPRTFIRAFEPFIIFMYDLKDDQMREVRIYEPQPGRPTRTIVAERGTFETSPDGSIIRLKLLNGSTDEADARNPDLIYKSFFKTYFITLNFGEAQNKPMDKKPKEMTLRELQRDMAELGAAGVDILPLRVEWHRKIAFSFSCLAFVLIGLPLGLTTKRGERLGGFALSLAVFITYYLGMLGGNALAERHLLSPGWAMWTPNLVAMALGLILFYRLAES